MMHRLKSLRCYLAGPIDNAPDDGVGWRLALYPLLQELGCTILDPCDKPIKEAKYREIDDEKRAMMALKSNGRYLELAQRMKPIVHYDLRMVDISDFVVAYLHPKVPVFGTVHEIVNSLNQRKPTLVVVEGGKKNAPNWLFGIMDYHFIFDSFEELAVYLKQLDDGTIAGDLSRWVFFENNLYGQPDEEE